MENIKRDIVEAIKKFSTIIIHRHVHPDPDAIGSQSGLQHTIKHSYSNKEVYVVGEEEERLKFINRMDSIPDTMYKGALVIVCDTANTSRISDKRYASGDMLIKIDHHPDYEPFGNLSWVDPSYSSASEMLVDLFLHFPKDFMMNQEAAKCLYAGIIADTGRFLLGNTSPRTLKIAAILRDYNIHPERIHNSLNKKNKSSSRLRDYILMNFKVTEKGVAHFKWTQEVLTKYGADYDEASNLINTLSTHKIWVFFIEYPTEIRVRIRSKKIPIQEIAQTFNGGGHPLASGATIHSWDEADSIIQALDDCCPF